jgi:preprotein translocase subunit SecG
MSILLNLLLVIYVLVALLMILVILMQRPKSEGLGAAFGGGVTENIFGAQTTNVLTKITGWLAGIFFFLTFALSVLYARQTRVSSGLRQELMKTAPASAPAGAPAAPITQDGPAVGAPGSVTNLVPGGDVNANQGNPPSPADQAVGLSAPSLEAPPAPSAQPSP